MVEFQQDFLGRSDIDLTEKKMARHTTDQVRDINMALARVGFNRGYSMFTRFFWIKFCDKINNYPKEIRHEPLQELDHTVDEVVAFLPVFKRQLEQGTNKRFYGR